MAKKENLGQAREHKVLDANGNVITMTQTDWKARDKSAGLTRVDEEEEIVEEETVVEPVPAEEAPPLPS